MDDLLANEQYHCATFALYEQFHCDHLKLHVSMVLHCRVVSSHHRITVDSGKVHAVAESRQQFQ